MRRRAAQRTPAVSVKLGLLRIRPRLKVEADAHRLLKREVARRPGVAVAEAEQEIDIRGPGSDAMQRGQLSVGGVGLFIRERLKAQAPGRNFVGDCFQRPDFRGG